MTKKFDLEQLIPKFRYPIIKELYHHDLSINRQILKDIVRLGKKVIPDLETVLTDIIEHDKEYAKQDDFNWYTPTHALHLMGELSSEQSLPKILEIFRQDEGFLEFWFSDSINDEMWEVIYKCGQNSLDLIEEFLKDQSVWMYSRTAVSEGLKQIALHHSNKREVIIGIYKRVIEMTKPYVKYKGKSRGSFLQGIKKDDAKDISGFYVSDLIDFKEPKLNKYLMSLFEEGVVETEIIGPESLQEDFLIEVKEIKSIYDRYDELERIYNRSPESQLQSVFNVIYPKVGRNNPCPCGSGKKYKRCHLGR